MPEVRKRGCREKPIHNQYRAEFLRGAQEITFFLKVERGTAWPFCKNRAVGAKLPADG